MTSATRFWALAGESPSASKKAATTKVHRMTRPQSTAEKAGIGSRFGPRSAIVAQTEKPVQITVSKAIGPEL